MEATSSIEYRFGSFRLLPAQRQLLDADRSVKLGGRAFDTLLALVEQRDRAISKRELMDRVWPKLVVEENNLQVQIVALRKVLGPAAIATIPGRGYRFTLPVEAPSTVPAMPPVEPLAGGSRGELTRKTNLPEHLTPLYGRDQDLAAVRALLEPHALVSIVGAGGIGKTCLAQAVASTLLDEFANGVWIVELAALSDPGLVIAEVARSLGIQLGDKWPALDSIIAWLASQSMLVVLDNCEHLLESVASLADAVTHAAPTVRLLVTSQEPLKTADEHVYRLDALAVPAERSAQDVAHFGAVQLFVARAQATDPRFALTDDNAAAVIEICRRLDGIPLALELAAARIPLLGIEGLRTRLDQRFHVLTGGSRFVLRRHQTLRAAFDFSHALLGAEEQAVFRRLGVFTGSFALESAQQVCSDDAIDAWAALECLGALVDKSMVIAEGDSYPRLRLLETTRAYALEKLADAGETTTHLTRHANAIAVQMSRVYEDLWRLPEDDWLARYDVELDNLRAALTWALRHDHQLAIALVGDSLKLWQHLALQPEALQYCEAALTLITPDTSARAAGRLWYALAQIVVRTWPTRARDAAARAVTLLRAAGDTGVLAYALARLAGWSRGKPNQQQLDALAELDRLENSGWTAQLRMLPAYANAMVNESAGRFAEARRDYTRARDFAASCGATGDELAAQHNVADMALMMGDLDDAIDINRDVIQRVAPRRDRLFYMFTLTNLTTALLFKGDCAAVRETFALAVPLILHYGLGFGYACSAALLAVLEERTDAAARMLGYSDAAFIAHGADARDPKEMTARDMVIKRLAASEDPVKVQQWMREGASLSDAEAYGQALMTTPQR
jgi:predicted ATPase/DNA-binding winged helix-turn-helix (wHTH) protein